MKELVIKLSERVAALESRANRFDDDLDKVKAEVLEAINQVGKAVEKLSGQVENLKESRATAQGEQNLWRFMVIWIAPNLISLVTLLYLLFAHVVPFKVPPT